MPPSTTNSTHFHSSEDFSEFSSYSNSNSSDYSMNSTNSTPSKSGKTAVITNFKCTELELALKEDLVGHLKMDIPLVDFIKRVFRFNQTTLDLFNDSKTWEVDASLVKDYEDEFGSEVNLYKPFVKIVNQLLARIIRKLEVENPGINIDNTSNFWQRKGNVCFTTETSTRKPDVLTWSMAPSKDWEDEKTHRNYTNVKHPWEFKTHAVRKARTTGNDMAKEVTIKNARRNGNSNAPPSSDSPSTALATTSTESRASSSNPSLSSDTLTISSSTSISTIVSESSSTPGKRPRSGSDNDFNRGRPAKQRRHGLQEQQIQLNRYSLECLASNTRLYNVGVNVDNFKISLTYVDRMVCLCTEWINMKTQPHHFALLICALSLSTAQTAGFNPFLTGPITTTVDCVDSSNGDLTEDMNLVETKENTDREVTSTTVTEKVSPAESRSHWSESVFEATKKLRQWKHMSLKDWVFQFEDCGEGLGKECSTMWDTVAQRSAIKISKFVIEKTIFRPGGLFGRMTSVYKTTAFLPGQTRMVDVALKVSWPLAIRHPEPFVIQHLRKTIPGYRRHLPTILFDVKYSAQELGIPWMDSSCSWTEDMTNFELRNLQVFATPVYNRLWKVKNTSELKKVWLDAVKCHHAAWETGRVLHRDVSINNIMFTTATSGADNDKMLNVIAILNDWDLASFLDPNDQIPRSGAKHRTGTLPFMAVDLLVDLPPRHEFHHDLESFFWVLLWAAIFFDFSGEEPKIQDISDKHDILKGWVTSGAIQEMRLRKKAWFSDPNEVLQLIPEVNSDLKHWLRALMILFRNAYNEIYVFKMQADQSSASEEGDHSLEGLKHQVTYAKFMDAISGNN